MPEIVLTEEQAQIFAAATGPIAVMGRDGIAVGSIDPGEAAADAAMVAEILEARRHAVPEARLPGEVVWAHLEALRAERERLGGGPMTDAQYEAFSAAQGSPGG